MDFSMEPEPERFIGRRATTQPKTGIDMSLTISGSLLPVRSAGIPRWQIRSIRSG